VLAAVRTNPADGPPKKAPVLDGREPPTASQRLRDDIEEVSEKHHEAQERCEQEVVKLSLDNLMTFPWIVEPVRVGTLRLHGMRFDIRSGVLEMLHGDGVFRAV